MSIYIYTPYTWTPWSDTVWYRELNWNAEDTKNDYGVTTYTTTNYDATGYAWTWYPTYVDGKNWKQCAYFDGARWIKLPTLPVTSNHVTFCVRVKMTSLPSTWNPRVFFLWHDTSSYTSSRAFLFSIWSDGLSADCVTTSSSSGTSSQTWYSMTAQAITLWERYNLVYTFNAGTMKFYMNGVLKQTQTGGTYIRNNGNREWWIWFFRPKTESNVYMNWYVQDMIYENKVRSEDEILRYYNGTK